MAFSLVGGNFTFYMATKSHQVVVCFFVCEQAKKPVILFIAFENLATATGNCLKLWLYEIGKIAQFLASLVGFLFVSKPKNLIVFEME